MTHPPCDYGFFRHRNNCDGRLVDILNYNGIGLRLLGDYGINLRYRILWSDRLSHIALSLTGEKLSSRTRWKCTRKGCQKGRKTKSSRTRSCLDRQPYLWTNMEQLPRVSSGKMEWMCLRSVSERGSLKGVHDSLYAQQYTWSTWNGMVIEVSCPISFVDMQMSDSGTDWDMEIDLEES